MSRYARRKDSNQLTTVTKTTSQAQALAFFLGLPLAEVEKVLGKRPTRKTKKGKK